MCTDPHDASLSQDAATCRLIDLPFADSTGAQVAHWPRSGGRMQDRSSETPFSTGAITTGWCHILVAMPTFNGQPDLIPTGNLPMQREPGWQGCLKMDLFSGDGVAEFQKLGVQKITSVAGEAGEMF